MTRTVLVRPCTCENIFCRYTPPVAKSKGFSKFRSKLAAFAEIERQIRRGKACTGPSLARDLNVTPRSVRRYIEYMRDGLGAPIEFDPIDQTYTFTNPNWTMPNVHLSDHELTALAIGTRSLAAVMPKPFTGPLDELLNKLLDALPESRREEIRLLKESVDIVPTAIASKGVQWMEPLMHAMRDERSVEMDYYVLYKRKSGRRIVDPYHLRYYAGAWYLVGYDHSIKRFPVFNLARVRELNPTERSFRRKPFSASDYFRDAVGITVGGSSRLVRIRLTGRAAETAAERVWPDGFNYHPNNDGSGVIEGHVGKLDDLLAWIASTGGEASVL